MAINLPEFEVGTLIQDGDKVGIIYRLIQSGTWSEEPLFNWRTNYEIYYDDGTVCVMGGDTLQRLVKSGRVEVLRDKE